MSQSNQLLNKNFVLRGEFQAVIPHTDGDIRFAEVTGVSARFASEQDELEHVIMGQRQIVDRETDKISATVQMAFREALSPQALDLFVGQALPQTIDSAYRMRNMRQLLPLYGSDKLYLPAPYGLLQQHTSAEFPPPTGVNGADTVAAGTISAGTYYAWVVPMYIDADVHRPQTFSLANLATMVRGVDYILGTPSNASSAITAAGNKGLTVNWTGIGTPPAGMPTPQYYLVVVGSTNVFSDATSKICAVVAYPLITATFTAIGATSVGTTPALSDLFGLQYITNPSGTRVFVSLSSGTDYTYDAAVGTVALTTAGAASHSGKGFRINSWFISSPSVVQPFGSANTTERVLPVRLYSLHGSTANVSSRRPYGAEVNLWEVDFARIADELLTSPGRRFHTAKSTTLPANWNAAQGGIGDFRSYAPEFNNLIDWYGPSVAP